MWKETGNSANLYFYTGPDDLWAEVLVSCLVSKAGKWIVAPPKCRLTLYRHGVGEIGRTSWKSKQSSAPSARTVARMAGRII